MKNVALLFFVFFGLLGKAQDLDPQAKQILDDLKSTYDAYSAVEMSFSLEIEIPEQAMETQKGSIIQSGKKYKIDLDDQSIYCNGSVVWVHLKTNKEVQINDYEEDMGGELMSPNDLLNVYESGEYEYALVNEERQDGVKVQQIEFKPTDRDSEYSKMRLSVIKGKKRIQQVKVFAKDGSRFTMKVHETLPNKKYTPETFEFDGSKFPEVYIEDLRL